MSNSAKNEISLEEFRKIQLKIHNELRKKHNAEPLILDEELNEMSLKWAQKLAKDQQLKHSAGSEYGENLFFTTSDINSATERWYSEIEQIDPKIPLEKEFRSKQIGHFTAVVWKSSKKVGISFAKDARGYYYVVANYHPAGNFLNQVEKNVQL